MFHQEGSILFRRRRTPKRGIHPDSCITQGFFEEGPFGGAAVIIAAVLLLAGCRDSKSTAQKPAVGRSSSVRPARIIGIGRVEPEFKISSLAAEVQGLIAEIHARPGGRVRRGDVIVELIHEVEDARVEQMEAKVRVRRADIESAKAALAGTKIKAENARLDYERRKTLFNQDAQAEYLYDNAKADYEALIEDVKRFEAGVSQAEALLDQDRADLKLARAELGRRFIRAPTDGRILSLDATAGSAVTPETAIGAFAPDSPLSVWCEIDEMFAADVKEGQKATIRKQGTNEEIGRGRVVFAGPYLRKKSLFSDEIGDLEDRRVREIRIQLESGHSILIGSRVECVLSMEE